MITNIKTLTNLNNFYHFYNGDPLSFNGLYLSCVDTGNTLCGDDDIWSQYDMPLSREKLAQLILQGEQAVEAVLGTPIKPKWITETIEIPTPFSPFAKNIRGMTFRTGKRNVKHFGQRKLTKIETVSLTYSDLDGDGFDEVATLTTTLPENVDLCDVKVYFPDRLNEITGVIFTDYNTTTRVLNISIDSWLLVKPEKYISRSFLRNQPALDGCDTDNFVTTVDIYTDSVDTTKAQVELVYYDYDCNANCVETRAPACVKIIDSCQGTFQIIPQSYDSEGNIVANNGLCKFPKKMVLHYQAGCFSQDCSPNSCNDDCVCQELENIVFKIAAARYPAPTCDCKCVQSVLLSMAQETSLIVKEEGRVYRYPSWMINESLFGTKVGEIEAAIALLNIKEEFCNFE